MIRNPMQAILQFAENRGEDANILTGRLNQVFGPIADMLVPASAPETSPFPPPQRPRPQGPQLPAPPIAGVAGAGSGFTNVELPDGTVQRREGTRAWRNNNPGNIEFGDFARSRGAVGTDGRFAVFPSYEDGRAAKEALLFESPSYRDRTIAGAINRYAPPSENDTRNYVGTITNALGVSPDTPLSDLTPDQRNLMLNTMERIEGFRPGRVDGVDADEIYRSLGNALNVRVSSSGTLGSGDRRNVESMLGDILNEVYDPESAIADDKRNRVADLLTGLGVGFGQMSRGDRVDLSEVRDAAERRRNQNIQLRMERAKRSAGASYAMELGDEGLARAIAGGAADINTLLTKRQQDMVDRRANEAVLRESQQAGMLANVMQEAGGFSESQMEAIRSGANPAAVFSIAEQKRAAEQAAAAQERAESQITFIQEMQQRLMQPQQDGLADLPDIDPITERALFLAELDGYQKIYEGGSLNDYMSEARQQAAEMRQQAAAGSDRDTAAELQIQRLLELPEVTDRETAIRIRDGVLTIDNDGVLRNTATGEPVNRPTAGLSAPRDTSEVGPPRDETGTSLFNRVGQATGLLSAGAGLLESTVGQLTSDPLFPERAETIQELNTLRGVLVDAFRNSGRLLSQELQLLLEEVAPGSSVWQSPGQLRAKVGSIDRELRQRLAEERARADDPGVPTSERTASANLARDIDRVLTRLHQPAASAAPASAPEPEASNIPEEVRRSPVFEQLRASAEQSGVTPEEVWQFLPDSAKQRFLEGVQ
jgi:hypothetical protein